MSSKNQTYSNNDCFKFDDSSRQNVQKYESVDNIQQIMQNQNHFLKSMLLQLLDELKKSSLDKDFLISLEDNRSVETVKELNKLKKENKRIKETLAEKQMSLSKCLLVLENSNKDIQKLSKHIETLCAERDKYKNEVEKIQVKITKKDATINTHNNTISKSADVNTDETELCQEIKFLKEQLEDYKTKCDTMERDYTKEMEELNDELLKLKNTAGESFEEDANLSKLKRLEDEVQTLNSELSEYEEENTYYCQKIETLLKTLKCLQEAKVRSEEDNEEYSNRFNTMRLEFNRSIEEKNKIIETLTNKLQNIEKSDQRRKIALVEKDEQINELQEKLIEIANKQSEDKFIEDKYKDCQEQFDYYFEHLKTLQVDLNDANLKLDICNKTIKDFENRNKCLEQKIVDLQISLEEKMGRIANWEVALKEMQCINLRLEEELRSKILIIRNLEECLDNSNRILLNCEKEMSLVEKRTNKFKGVMCHIKRKLEGELLQNQFLEAKCHTLNSDYKNPIANEKYIACLKNQYRNVLAEAQAKKSEIHYLKEKLVECFKEETEALSDFKTVSSNPSVGTLYSKFEIKRKFKTEENMYPFLYSSEKSLFKIPIHRSRSCYDKLIGLSIKKNVSEPDFCRLQPKISTFVPFLNYLENKPSFACKLDDVNNLANFNPKTVVENSTGHNTKNKCELGNCKSDGNIQSKEIHLKTPPDYRHKKHTCSCMTVIARMYEQENEETIESPHQHVLRNLA